MEITDYTSVPHKASRIVNALWHELHPSEGARPAGWHPTPDEVRGLNLREIIGPSGTRIVRSWLQEAADSEHERMSTSPDEGVGGESVAPEGQAD
ncbi:hypothetical protein GCM10007874_60050 [Labrys miyagiensis]|uniref:Antitoxin Xre/MbcA/ParS-like toxin-binding domain-containing protein n=1 Tax=Labrys miyagiensis TaxID=346912 RepID=A0ABQ6CSA3_9HYPH|nr:hypothetical protein GCM10007874_60050 [Labrys miyagiensis]